MMKKNITKILVIIAVITICIGAKVYADYVMNASEVEYTKSDSSKVSVKAALDDLYTKSQEFGEKDLSNVPSGLISIAFSKSSVGLTYTESQSILITNPNSYEITVEISDSTVATVTKNSNTEIIINALSKEGNAVITVKATVDDKTYTMKKIGVGVWENGMPISEAKSVINASNIADYIGTQVDYTPIGGGTWRIFYYDETGKYGDGAGTVYIKRDYDSSITVSIGSYGTYYTDSSSQSILLADMRKI
ncbi:MAG: hypothetical protein IJ809_05695 [Clostridia bacterium]|nr:hypothetical protein [Clostridia bacterium]